MLFDWLDGNFLAWRRGVPELGIFLSIGASPFELGCAAPFALDRVECVGGLVRRRHRGFERVRLAREVSFAAVVDCREVAAGRADVARAVELNVRRAPNEPLNDEIGQCDQVESFPRATCGRHSQYGVAHLLYGDAATAEGRLLAAVPLELDASLLVRDAVGGDWRVVGDLLCDELSLSAPVLVGPCAKELLAEDGIERLRWRNIAQRMSKGSQCVTRPNPSWTHLLFAPHARVARGVLSFECPDEPAEHVDHLLDIVLAFGTLGKEVRVFSPVRRVLGQTDRREDERWSSHARQIPREGGDGLEELQSGEAV